MEKKFPKAPPKEIRIVFVSYMLIKMGGAERNLHDLAINLSRKGYELFIVTFIAGEVAEELAAKGIPVLEMPIGRLLSMKTLRKGFQLVRLLKKQQIDILVTYHADADVLGGISGKLAGVPVIISNRRDMGFGHSTKYIWFYRIFGKFITAFITVSNAVRDVVIHRDGVDPGKVHVVHNGVNKEYLFYDKIKDKNPRVYGETDCRIVIGVLGRFEFIKGQKILVRVAHMLKRRVPNFSFLCVGFNDTEYYREMADMIKDLELGDHFRFVGHQNHIASFVSEMDFLIFPSRSEGFSNAVIEVMAMGKPVIATRVGGNPEAVVDGETGFIVSPDHLDEFQKAAETLCMDPQLRLCMGNKARARVEQMFTVEKMVCEYEGVFHHYLNSCWRANKGR